ncbi:amidase [Frigidibacter sp. MR17.24]|uniref:amidase n=1 Tax=Frigidibacter sp. MR17.24 TaxID=3127345 RepID=UPI003012C8DD
MDPTTPAGPAPLPDMSLAEMSLAELRAALDRGAVSCVALVSACLARIAADNHAGRALHAVIAVNPAALDAARVWDDARARGQAPPGALSGIPFLAKDNFDTAAMATTGGSLALAGSVPAADAAVVRRLIEGGAILLGKTNLSELAASCGWLGHSSVGGQAVNPFHPLRDPSGSSGGSAVAVAARFAPFALGTDTSGSIRAPAATTGTVGLRPTPGLTSRAGVIPLALCFDTVGAITRTVADQAIVLDAIRGPDAADPATDATPQPVTPFVAQLACDPVPGARLGVVGNFRGANPEVDALFAAAVDRIAAAGASMVAVTLPEPFTRLWPLVLEPVGRAEFRPQFDAYLAGLGPDQPRDMAAFLRRLSALTGAGTERINPARYRALTEAFEAHEDPATATARDLALRKTMPALRRALLGLFDDGRLDALVFMTMSCPASVIRGLSDPSYACDCADPYAACYIAPATGCPELSIPAGVVAAGVPVGLSLLGRPGADGGLLALGAAIERLCG